MDRKEFLKALGYSTGALMVMSCVGGCKKSSAAAAPTNVDFTIDITQSAYAALANNGGYIYKDGIIVAKTVSGTIIAVSQACTHEGTSVVYQSSSDRFYCSNHGATFNTSGAVTKGPANTALAQYNVTVTGNSVRVYS